MKKVLLSLMILLLSAGLYAQKDTLPYKEGEVLVKFKTEANEKWLKKFNVHIKKLVYTKNMKNLKQKGFYVMEVDNVKEAVAKMSKDNEVLWAEPNFLVQHQGMSADPLFQDLWGIVNIKAQSAWNSGNKGKQEILVGVIDEGAMLHHEDLCGQIWVNPFDPEDGIDNDGNGYIDDINGWDFKNENNRVFNAKYNHGSHVSGTIGAIGDNNKGIIGVAPHVKLIQAKFLEGSGFISDAVEAIDYITDLKIRHNLPIPITNNSWGGGYSSAVYAAIDRARQADILFAAAAGNSGGNDNDLNPFYPASHDLPNIISVAAIDVNDQLASFSCYGKTTVDIGAPGVAILSSIASGPATSSYSFYNGTSMATPHVTGAAVLYKALNPTATGAQIKAAILNAARPIAALQGKTVTGGTLDVSSFTGNVSPSFVTGECAVPPLDSIRPTTPTNLRSLGIVSPTDYKVKWDLSTDSSGIEMYFLTAADSVGTTIINYILNGADNLVLGEGQIYSLTYGKTYQFSIRARDNWGNWSESSNTIVVNTNPTFNNQPEPEWYAHTLRYDSLNNNGGVCIATGGIIKTYYSQSITLGQNVYIGNSKSLSDPAKKGFYSEGKRIYYIPRQVDREIGIISWIDSCWIGDPIDTTPPVNKPPTVSAGNDVNVGYPSVITLIANGQDPEGKVLTYRWILAGGPYFEIPNPNNASITFTPPQAGWYIFRVYAKDPEGLEAYDDVEVTLTAAPPPNPSNIYLSGTVVNSTTHRLNWSWTGLTPSSFRIEYSKGTTFATLATLPYTTLTYTNRVKGGGTANYRIVGSYANNTPITSNVVSLKIGGKTSQAGTKVRMTDYPSGSYYIISSLSGAPYISGTIKSKQHIQDISNLVSGFYVVTILYPDGEIEATKIVR